MALCGGILSSGLALAATPGATGPVVVELFTTENCGSCAAVDRSLDRWDATPGIIVLSEFVDFLDQTGWKDPFASPVFSTRQLDYATALHTKDLYTPQVIINGEKALVGTDPKPIDVAISAAASVPRAPVTLKWVQNPTCLRARNCSNVALTVGTLPPNSHKADVLLAITENGLQSNVQTGENAGRLLRHVAVVRMLMRLAEVDPAKPGEYAAEAYVQMRPEWIKNNVKVVVFVQDRDNRHILGAASVGWVNAPRSRP
jgi:hypothetical protein